MKGGPGGAYSFSFDELDTALGTLWWVRENVWATQLANYRSERKSHPGLSVSRGKSSAHSSYVPMLHGRSRRRGDSFSVVGLTRTEPNRITYFKSTKPARIAACLFTHWTVKLDHEDPHWTRDAAIIVNQHKPRLSSAEEREFDCWWERRRARQPWCKGRRL